MGLESDWKLRKTEVSAHARGGGGRKISGTSRPASSIVTVANELAGVVVYCTT